ncbi:MAG: phosphoglucosamine mutase [Acidobacteria bacterium]|nr:phosphoglucosamine mutase [Acidobacteriota bacterium]
MTDTRERQLFGTDGIRGVAGQYPLDRRTVEIIGRALGIRLAAQHPGVQVVIGQDTRESSEWIAELLARGLASQGVKAVEAGIITTPGVAYLARARAFAAGIVISASHNPWHDNGIKVFGHDGYKLSDAIEHEIEAEIFRELEQPNVAAEDRALTGLPPDPELHAAYVRWLAQSVAGELKGIRALVDCANGATAALGPEVLRACQVEAEFLNINPDGRNINAGCGALHPDAVAQAVLERSRKGRHFDLGITFDGDGDRALFSDAEGRVVNGDAVLLLAARQMKRHGSLRGDTVVATTMSNMGLEAALRREGIRMLRAPVGDKYVLEQMQKTGAALGGEQSGHIIFRDGDSTTGDGMLTALRVMAAMAERRASLAELTADLKVFPQVITNIRVREKKPLAEVPPVQQAIARAERELGTEGRLVVRYSGTEALARVMVEAESESEMRRVADEVSGVIRHELGE